MTDNVNRFDEAALLRIIPQEQQDRVFGQAVCDIDGEFLGFLDIYEHLAAIIPKHWTIIDLGCAYTPQAFLFRNHFKYIGVDLPWNNSEWHPDHKTERFKSDNTVIYEMPIAEFIDKHLCEFDMKNTFAICSYVPPWGGDNMKLARDNFTNVFTYYPSSEPNGFFDIIAKKGKKA